MTPRVAVVVPVHDQAAFLGRALGSLLAQRLVDWEAVVVDGGSGDDPLALVPADARIAVRRHGANRGLGAALNTGLDATAAPLLAYLPADDAWDADHLERLVAVLAGAALAWSGVRWVRGATTGAPAEHGLQLVQVAHRRTSDRWPERDELESDDLEHLMWRRLRGGGTTSTVVAAERIVGAAGVLYDDVDDLVDRLRDRPALDATAAASWSGRAAFTFDAWTDGLVAVLRRAIDRRA